MAKGLEIFDKQQKTIFIIVVLLCVGIFLSLFFSYRNSHEKSPGYFMIEKAQDGTSKTYQLLYLKKPLMTNSILLNWASLAAVSAFNYNASNYKQQLSTVFSDFFTREGAEAYYKQLIADDTLSDVVKKQLIVTAVVGNTPIILQQGRLSGVYTWKVQVPLLVTYQSLGGSESKQYLATMLIIVIPTWKNPRGIGVQQFLVG